MCRILIVDDEMLLRQGIIHMTNWDEYGFSVAGEASNGEEALHLIEISEPEIVITDIRMPVMDGIELTRKIKENYPQIQVIVLSSYNDFDYVRETLKLGALDYLLKSKMDPQELLSLLKKAKQKLNAVQQPDCPVEFFRDEIRRDNFLKDLLSGKFEDETLIKQRLDQIKLPLEREQELILVITVVTQKNEDDGAGTNRALIETIQNVFAQFFNCYTFFCNCSYVTILNYLPQPMEQLRNIGCQVIDQIADRHRLKAGLIISDGCKGLSNLATSYCQAIQKIPYLFYMEPQQIILPNQFFTATILESDFEPLPLFIEKQDLSGLKQYVETQINEPIQAGHFPEPYALKKWLIEICYLLIQSATKLGYNTISVSKNKFSIFKKIESVSSLRELLTTFNEIINDFENILAESQYLLYHPVIKRIIEYLSSHYAENITLALLASLFHINKSYLCQLFKSQTGKNLNNYLTRIRIEKAKDLLLNPENNIYLVGNLVGFPNPSYFTQTFKNLVGSTPSEYVKCHIGRCTANSNRKSKQTHMP
jgi:two-component system response regulator YesN